MLVNVRVSCGGFYLQRAGVNYRIVCAPHSSHRNVFQQGTRVCDLPSVRSIGRNLTVVLHLNNNRYLVELYVMITILKRYCKVGMSLDFITAMVLLHNCSFLLLLFRQLLMNVLLSNICVPADGLERQREDHSERADCLQLVDRGADARPRHGGGNEEQQRSVRLPGGRL